MNRIADLLKREPPGRLLNRAIARYTQQKLNEKGCMIEIGCMRGSLTHPLIETHHQCCLDGHSTIHFAKTGFEFQTCDISAVHCNIALKELQKLSTTNWKVIRQDGIEFLSAFKDPISLLYLDAWDVDDLSSISQHRLALLKALPNMAQQSLILIDDTDVDYDFENKYYVWTEGKGGKGKAVIPLAEENGYQVIFIGRQVLLGRE